MAFQSALKEDEIIMEMACACACVSVSGLESMGGLYLQDRWWSRESREERSSGSVLHQHKADLCSHGTGTFLVMGTLSGEEKRR